MPRLPPELFTSITRHLDDIDLGAFALTCRELNEIARRRRVWMIKDIKKAVEFLDMLKSDQGLPSSLRPSSIRCINFAPPPSRDQAIEYQPGEALQMLAHICLIVKKCVNLVQVSIFDLGYEARSIQAETKLFEVLSKLRDLRLLVMGCRSFDLKAFAYFTKHSRAYLNNYTGMLRASDEDFKLRSFFSHHLQLALFVPNDTVYSKAVATLFPNCQDCHILVRGNLTPSTLAQSLSLPIQGPLLNATISFTSTAPPELFALPPDLPKDGSTAFYFTSRDDRPGEKSGRISKGHWSQKFIESNFGYFKEAVGVIWAMEGDSMGSEGKRMVLNEARKHGKKVVWF